MPHLEQVLSVGPVVSHCLSMPSVSMELTQLTSNTLQVQLSPSASTPYDHFINSDVSTCTVQINNAENWIVCHSKSSAVNFDSRTHSHSNSHTDIRDHIIPLISIFVIPQSNIPQILRPMKLAIWLVLFHPSKTSAFLKSQIVIFQLYTQGDQLKENKEISVTAIKNRLHDYQSQIKKTLRYVG